jgi:D-sedoheptulose 7-phosphate isomerase
MKRINAYLDTVSDLLAVVSREDIQKIVDLVRDAYKNDKQVFIMGNGGSAATASHLACDLQKGITSMGTKRFRVMAVTDNVAVMTAWANDADYSEIFAQQIATWVEPGDLVLGISGSGNSPNVIKGIEVANEKGAITAGLAGFKGGKLAQVAKYSVVVPSDNMQHIEDVHMVVSHLLFRYLLEEIAA